MIQLTNISISYGGRILFENASCTINPRERCAVIGRNGSGKSTLLKLISGLETADCGTITFSKGYKVGYLNQHIQFSKPSVLEEATSGLPESEQDNVYKAEALLFGLGFKEEDLLLSPSKLSGGYQLRLHLIKTLLSEPDCLLLDEPTNYLDILSIRFLTRFLLNWKGELLVVSHDRMFLDSIATHTLGIHRNTLRKIQGPTSSYFEQVLQEERLHEASRMNLEKKKEHLQEYISRFGAKASKASQAQSRKKLLERLPVLEELKHIDNLEFTFTSRPFYGKKLADVQNASFSYEPNTSLIKNCSFIIEPNERIAIVGKNGYGKSTLLRLIAQEILPLHGSISYAEQVSIGYFGQTNINRLLGTSTVEEEISSANPTLPYTKIKQLCGQMMFPGSQSEKKISVLSGGEKSRVLLGKILTKPCNLLLLDEPTHHLDVESVESLIDAIEDFEGAVIIVTHNELILERLPISKLIVCHADRQDLFLGGYLDFLEKIGWEEEKAETPKEKSKLKEEKRKRAEFVAMRSKMLKPIKEKMERFEKTIQTREKELSEEQLLLQKALEEGKPVHDLLMACGKKEKEIESLYDELWALSDQFEQKKKELGDIQ